MPGSPTEDCGEGTAFATAIPVLFVGLIAAGNLALIVAFLFTPGITADRKVRWPTALKATFGTLGALKVAFRTSRSDCPHQRLPDFAGDLPLMLGQLGGISRALFATLQRSRFTWTAPPEVADRALRLAFPVQNINTTGGFGECGPNQAAQFHRVGDFVMEAATLVAMRRPHLIPACRSLYPDLPRHDEQDLNDRIALYLDPMRHRTRWEVIKDFALPLAAWLGVVVSLWISLTR